MRTLAVAILGALAFSVSAQPSHQPRMHMARAVLFTATANSAQVVPKRPSAATATVGVTIDRTANDLRYDLTYHGLEHGAPTRIALHNFGPGGTGAAVAVLCGQGAAPCPARPSARLAGAIGTLRLTALIFSEFVSSRVYVEIVGGDGRPEIRGQLTTNGAMVPVRNYLARLAPVPGAAAAGEGTAVLSETYLPRGQVGVQYSVTVAGTSGPPQEASLTGVTRQPDVVARFLKSARLPITLRSISARARGGGTFSGRYVARQADRSAVLAVKLLDQDRVPAITVKTGRFPRGELVGVFMPVE